MFICIRENRNKCIFGRKGSTSSDLHLVVSFGRSPPTPSSQPGEPPAQARCCEIFAACSIKLLHQMTLRHCISICLCFSVKRWGPPGLKTMFTTRYSQHKWSPWHLHRAQWPSQFSCGGKNSCTIQVEDAKMDEMLIKEVELAWFLTSELLLTFQIVSVIK